MHSMSFAQEVCLDYVVEGRQQGVPAILLHGFTDSCKAFSRVMTWLPQSMCTVAVSQRGHGESDRPETGYSPSDFAADIASLMDRLDLEQAVIIGHCMGATVAQQFAIDYPERVRGLVLASSFFKLQGHPLVLDLWESTVSKLQDPIDPSMVRTFQSSAINKQVPKLFFDSVIRESLKVPARVWKATLQALMETDLTPELQNIHVPTMLLWGDQDVFVGRSEQEKLLASIPGSRLKVYSGTGHSPHWEDPARFAADIADFVMAFRALD